MDTRSRHKNISTVEFLKQGAPISDLGALDDDVRPGRSANFGHRSSRALTRDSRQWADAVIEISLLPIMSDETMLKALSVPTTLDGGVGDHLSSSTRPLIKILLRITSLVT